MPETQMTVQPSCYLIGAQKAGTTYLASLMDQSRDICVSDPKEPHFFSSHYDRGFDWYGTVFSDTSKRLVDASTTYSFIRPAESHPAYMGEHVGLSPDVISRMKEASPDAKIIYLLRHPVDRTYSGFLHRARFSETQSSLIEYYKENPMLRLASCYSAQIERYLEQFSKEQILCLRANDMYADPLGLVNRCLSFLDLAPLIAFDPKETNQHKSYVTGKLYRTLNRIAQISPIKSAIEQRVGNSDLYKQAKARMKETLTRPAPELTESEREFLNEEFRDEVGRTHALTGIDFPIP